MRALIGAGAMMALVTLALSGSPSSGQPADGGYRVFRPGGAGPHPAVALVSGCSGFSPAGSRHFYGRVADTLRGQGYVVVFVDYVGRRGLPNCSRPPAVSEGDAAKDLVAAVSWLRSDPSVDTARISALGWSYGGGAVLVALAAYTEAQLGIARAAVYYPICRAVRPWRVATPVLMLLGGDDPIAPSEGCRAAAQGSARPDAVKIVTYHGALHAFDVSEIPAESRGPAGYMGYNAQAAAAAWEQVERFLRASGESR